jgi:hypothetical protein
MVQVDFDMQLTLAASLLDLSGKVEVTAASVVVTLDKRAHSPYLAASGLADQPTSMPWLGAKKLIIQFARVVTEPLNAPIALVNYYSWKSRLAGDLRNQHTGHIR